MIVGTVTIMRSISIPGLVAAGSSALSFTVTVNDSVRSSS